jgi:glycosyltransferase involved in cell wall biosynthesis
LKVGILSYPMLFQNEGGLQIQVRETIHYLTAIGLDVELVDVGRESLAAFDVIHVFAAIHGNHKLVEMAKAKGRRVVLSPIINPSLVPSSAWSLGAVKLLDRALSRLSNWTVTTNYQMVRSALIGADHLITLSASERSIVSRTYGVNEDRISIVPNGVSPHFFDADKELFLHQFGMSGPFVFCPALISPWKNQKSLVQAMAGTNINVVLAGPVSDNHRPYLDECLNVPSAKVTYIGNLERNSPVFSSCYAAASAVVLPSKGESGPLVAIESLAAGTPAVITRKNGLDLNADGRCLSAIDPFDVAAMRDAVCHVVQNRPDPAECQRLVAHLSWLHVAKDIAAIYAKQLPATQSKRT